MSRPVSVPSKRRPFADIRMLPCYPEVKRRLAAGHTAASVVRYIQDHEGHLTEKKPRKLAARLSALRRKLATLELVKHSEPALYEEARNKLDNGLNELEELASIYAIQKERIGIGYDLEKKLKVLNKTLGNEVRIAAELLRTRHQVKQDLRLDGEGIDRGRAGPAEMLNVRSRYGERVARVVNDASKRTRVLEIVARAMEKAQEEKEGDVVASVAG